jgi:GNAT superfamily N-acetyltransferase
VEQPEYRLAIEDEPDPRALAFLEEQLELAAVTAAGVGDQQEFAIFVRDEEERIVAGAFGDVWGGCCQMHVVWVEERLRSQGWGRRLMAAVDDEARRRGCRLVMGITYEVLTGDFYDRLGYRLVGSIEDCPAGTSTRWYSKDL